MHHYQNAEEFDTHQDFTSTATHLAARLAVTTTFVALAALLGDGWFTATA